MQKRLICIFSALIMAMSIALCAVGCNEKTTVVRVNEVTHSVFYTPMYLADSLGYFKEEGFEVEFTNGGGADATMAAVLSGGADIGFCGPEAAVYVEIGGSNDAPKVFGQLTKRDGSFLVSRVDEKQTFDWTKLEGKEILAGRKGGMPAMTFEYTLGELGITSTLNYDVAFNMMTSAFEGGVADYCTMFEPAASEYESAGKGFIVASVGEASGEIPYTCFMAKQSYIDDNESVIEGFTRAITKAIKYTMERSSSSVAQSIQSYFDGTSVKSLATAIDSYKAIDAWVTNMAMKESAYNRMLNIIETCGELERRVPFKNIVICDFADRVYKEIYNA